MNYNFYLTVSIFLEVVLVLLLFIMVTPIIVICLIINTIIMFLEIVTLFSKSNDKEVENQSKEMDYSKEIEDIMKITNINEQVFKFVNEFTLDINFLKEFLENFTQEQKKYFIEKLILYCRKELSHGFIDIQQEKHIMAPLNIAIKYKRDFIKE